MRQELGYGDHWQPEGGWRIGGLSYSATVTRALHSCGIASVHWQDGIVMAGLLVAGEASG